MKRCMDRVNNWKESAWVRDELELKLLFLEEPEVDSD